ncbi:uncharacterized protein LOC117334435 [Pecten maximus]|uniref:uncharacterized protein LOC117334435 n=1 Tax=Pecten maximus TaxID=6579 RepID=UPI0014591A92|nr:uncharacterized protein LOC117334435 [Pecten maximus]
MDYTKVATFCCLLCVVVGAALIPEKDYHCMFPVTWQSSVFMDSGMMIWIPEQMNASGTYFYDHPNKQMRLDVSGYALGNYHFSFTFIWKLLEKEVYTIDNNNKTCGKEADTIGVWNQWAGVPQDAVKETFGGLGGFKVIVSRYSLVRDSGDTDSLITLDVNEDSLCTPVRVSFQDTHLDPIAGEMVNYEFLDVMPLSDPTVFNTPSHCPNTTRQDTELIRRLLPSRHISIFTG